MPVLSEELRRNITNVVDLEPSFLFYCITPMMRRGLLLDRDGVINIDHGYVGTREKFEFVTGVFDFLRMAQDVGYRLAIITNQAGVARGYYTVEDYLALERWMLGEFNGQGVKIDLVMSCFEHRDGSVPLYKRDSFWRKPNPGMILDAAQQLQLDLKRSVFIGDRDLDMQAAEAAGVANRILFTSTGIAAPAGARLFRTYAEVSSLLNAIS